MHKTTKVHTTVQFSEVVVGVSLRVTRERQTRGEASITISIGHGGEDNTLCLSSADFGSHYELITAKLAEMLTDICREPCTTELREPDTASSDPTADDSLSIG